MKKLVLILLSVTITISCSSVKKNQQALNTGDYDSVIQNAIHQLKKGKEKKRKQPHILLLEQAYKKAVDRDIDAIGFLIKDGNSTHYEKIYETYLTLKTRQEKITPILPLYIIEENRTANFAMQQYDNEILNYKSKLSDYLYDISKNTLQNARSKMEYRNVYDDLLYLDRINPNYRDVNELIEEALFKGKDFIVVAVKNKTNVIIPRRLETDLLNFSTYGLDDLWTVYHNTPQKAVNYDYTMEVEFREISISPERIKERELKREKEVIDGWQYVFDKDGNHVLDDKGEKLKVDRIITVTCGYYEFTQSKAVQVAGNVLYKDLKTNQLIDTFPLSSEHVFEYTYARHTGDKRALDDDLIRFLGLQSVPFPSNEQMVYDSGENIKNKLKDIITRHKFN